jgi:hypothetical protein
MGNQMLVFLGLLLAGDRSFVNVGVGHDDWCVIRGEGEGCSGGEGAVGPRSVGDSTPCSTV